MLRKILLISLVFVLGAAFPAGAQQFPFETLTEKDGLPSSSVFSVTQDQDGLLWIATRAGVVTYDGLEWVTRVSNVDRYDHHIGHLARDGQGRIWMAGLRSPLQVGYWEDGRLNQLPPMPWERKDYSTHGFLVFTTDEGRTMAALTANSGHVWVWDGARWHVFQPDPRRELITTFAFFEGRLLAASSGGLFRVDWQEDTIEPFTLPDLPPGRLHTLLNDEGRGKLWLVGEDWVGAYEGGRCRLAAEGLDILLPTTINGVVASPDPVDGFYFGDSNRVYFFSAESAALHPITRRSGLVGEGTRSLFRDREGNLWFCGQRGLSKLISRRFSGYDRQQGLLRDEVSAILLRPDGEVILGHDGGLTFLEPSLGTLDMGERGRVLGRIMDLEEDEEGNVWMAADRLGLGRLDRSGNLEWLEVEPGQQLSTFCLAVGPEGRIWVGTAKGLYRQEGDRFLFFPLPGTEEGDNPFIRRIEKGRDGSLLAVAGVFGVFRIEGDRVTGLQDRQLVDGSFFTVLERQDGDFWVGTSRGLFRLIDGKLERSRAPFPEIHSSVYCLLETAAGEVWFGTENGALVWDGQTLRTMSAREGLLGSDTNRDALKQDDRGRIWIGTNRGLSIYDPRHDKARPAPPLVQLLELEVDGTTYPLDRPLRLDSPPRLLVADFRLVTFVERRGLGLRTWLEGFEETWQDPLPLHQRTMRYSHLPAGEYRLHLQAVRGDSLIGPPIASPGIFIPPPFFLRWWFLLPAAAVILLGLRLIFGLYSQHRYSRQLRTEVALRTRELNESREAIRYRSQRFQTTLNSVSDGVLTLAPDGRIILCNPAATRILGLEVEDLLDRTQAEVLPASRDLVPGHVRELEYQNPHRGILWVEALVTPLTQEEGPASGQVLVLRDVTTRRLHEAELTRTQKLESLGLLAGGLAHDFNNLLTIILGNIDLVEALPDFPTHGLNRLTKARRATVRARSLTEQLLTFARGGAPRRQLLQLGDMVEQTVSLVFTGSRHLCRTEIAPDLWPVNADGSQMNQVISNLLINACQAMPDGGQVYVFGTNIDAGPDFLPPGQYVLLEVRDQGVGISPRNLLKIFDPYFTTKETGSGLGLATAYSIVKRHGGMLKATSQEGQGSSFRVFLPRGQAASDDAPGPEAAAIPAGARILVMDDEQEVRHIVQAYLTRLDLGATLTRDGTEALDAWRSARSSDRPFAAAVFDLTVPEGMGGKEVLDRILEEDPAFPAVVISGYSSDAVMADHGRFGFRASLSKPFDFEQFARALGEAFTPVV